MEDDLSESTSALAERLKPGDTITTTLGRTLIVGTVHADQGQFWIEPLGADDSTWWVPLQNVVSVNGVAVHTRSSWSDH